MKNLKEIKRIYPQMSVDVSMLLHEERVLLDQLVG